jgi:hypothetical protein
VKLAYRIARSEDFVRRSEDITITILDNIHCSVFYLKREVSRMDLFRSSGQQPETTSFYWDHLSMFHMKPEADPASETLCFK